jgi:ABC-type lipoprotein release transport system permease subunit
MLLIAKIAFRNLARHKRRTLITICSIAFGLAVILWLQSILKASTENVINSVTKTHIGHIQVYQEKYFKDRDLKSTFPSPLATVQAVLPPEAKVTERVNLPALVSSGEQSLPVLLVGVRPELEKNFTVIASYLKEGAYLDPDEDCSTRQAVVGKALATNLGVGVGNKIVVLANAADGTMGNELLRVKGIFDSGAADFEKSMLFTTESCARKIGVLEGVHELAVRLPRSEGDLLLAAKIQAALGQGLSVKTWREVMPRINSIVHYNDSSFVLVSVMLFTVITLGIVNNVMVSVFERTKEFGVMLALGTSPAQVVLMVLLETIFMGLVASLLGILIGAAVVAYHQRFGFDLGIFFGKSLSVGEFEIDLLLHPKLEIWSFVRPLWITMSFVVLAAIYPAVLAARLKPVEAMR